MDVGLLILIFLIGFIGSFISGMLGIGGSIIKYPMLLYIPPLVGFAAFSAHEVSGISAIQVLFATISGVWAYRKGGYLKKDIITFMGISIFFGSLIGGYSSQLFSDDGVNLVYAILATIATVMMFIPQKESAFQYDEKNLNKTLASFSAFVVGVFSGVVGAAGAFILVPIMLVILKIPARITIANSLAITFISSIGATTSKIATGQIVWLPALVMIAASIIASPIGVNIGKKTNSLVLRWLLAILILATAIKIWLDLL